MIINIKHTHTSTKERRVNKFEEKKNGDVTNFQERTGKKGEKK